VSLPKQKAIAKQHLDLNVNKLAAPGVKARKSRYFTRHSFVGWILLTYRDRVAADFRLR